MRITRRKLQVSLGVLWLFDGALQCQPFMFRHAFSHQILVAAALGQPRAVAAMLHPFDALIAGEPALFNGLFAIIQIVLGLAVLNRRLTRVALGASIVWALSVWFVGEGLGGLATGATLLTGAPGAALLYAGLAVLAWPAHETEVDDRPSRMALPMWSALWFAAAGLQLVHGNDATSSLRMSLGTAQLSAPGWIAHLDHVLAQFHLSNLVLAGLIAAFVLIAIWSLIPGWTRKLSLGIGVLIAVTVWILFQGLGNLTSGQGTDPNSGPLIVLLALAVVGAYQNAVDDVPSPTITSEDAPTPHLELSARQ